MSISSPSDSLYPSPCRAGRPARVWAAFRCVAPRLPACARHLEPRKLLALIARARVHTGGPRGARTVVTARRLRRGGSGNRSAASLTRVNARLSALSCPGPPATLDRSVWLCLPLLWSLLFPPDPVGRDGPTGRTRTVQYRVASRDHKPRPA